MKSKWETYRDYGAQTVSFANGTYEIWRPHKISSLDVFNEEQAASLRKQVNKGNRIFVQIVKDKDCPRMRYFKNTSTAWKFIKQFKATH